MTHAYLCIFSKTSNPNIFKDFKDPWESCNCFTSTVASPYFVKNSQSWSASWKEIAEISMFLLRNTGGDSSSRGTKVIFFYSAEFTQFWCFKDHLLKGELSCLAVMREKELQTKVVLLSYTSVDMTCYTPVCVLLGVFTDRSNMCGKEYVYTTYAAESEMWCSERKSSQNVRHFSPCCCSFFFID